MAKTYIVTASIEIEVCDCENEYEAIDIATDQIDLGNMAAALNLSSGVGTRGRG